MQESFGQIEAVKEGRGDFKRSTLMWTGVEGNVATKCCHERRAPGFVCRRVRERHVCDDPALSIIQALMLPSRRPNCHTRTQSIIGSTIKGYRRRRGCQHRWRSFCERAHALL